MGWVILDGCGMAARYRTRRHRVVIKVQSHAALQRMLAAAAARPSAASTRDVERAEQEPLARHALEHMLAARLEAQACA